MYGNQGYGGNPTYGGNNNYYGNQNPNSRGCMSSPCRNNGSKKLNRWQIKLYCENIVIITLFAFKCLAKDVLISKLPISATPVSASAHGQASIAISVIKLYTINWFILKIAISLQYVTHTPDRSKRWKLQLSATTTATAATAAIWIKQHKFK